MIDSNQAALLFSNLGRRRIQADFAAGKLTSDAGAGLTILADLWWRAKPAMVGFEKRKQDAVRVSPYNFRDYVGRSWGHGKGRPG